MSKQTKYDCFISHSSVDYDEAHDLVERLELENVKCWIAPRNIPVGSNYSEEIVKGIKSSDSTIILISEHSLASRHVHREVTMADELDKKIYPVKLIDIEIYGGLRFFCSANQEIHLFNKAIDPVDKLLASLKSTTPTENKYTPRNRAYKKKQTLKYILVIGSVTLLASILLVSQSKKDIGSSPEDMLVSTESIKDKEKPISEDLSIENQCANTFARNTTIEIPTVLENTTSDCDYYISPKRKVTFLSDTVIEPGTNIIMGLGSSLIFREGTLKANGTSDLPIGIVGEEDIVGYWKGISMVKLREVGLSNLNISNGGTATQPGVHFFHLNKNIRIVNTSISKSYGNGLKIDKGEELLEFKRNTFHSNKLAGMVLSSNHLPMLDSKSDYLGQSNHNGLPVLDLGSVYLNRSDLVVKDLGVPYLVDSISLSNSGLTNRDTLTIQEGVTILFREPENNNRSLRRVYNINNLIANGTAEKPIVFSGISEQGWDSFHAGGHTILKHVIIDGAGKDGTGALSSHWGDYKYGSVEFDNVTIRNSKGFAIGCSYASKDSYQKLRDLVSSNSFIFENNTLGDISEDCKP